MDAAIPTMVNMDRPYYVTPRPARYRYARLHSPPLLSELPEIDTTMEPPAMYTSYRTVTSTPSRRAVRKQLEHKEIATFTRDEDFEPYVTLVV